MTVKVGPYPHVTLFEAADRIMTDLVILYGVKWILSADALPFETYNVEYGNEDSHGFDLRASSNGRELVGGRSAPKSFALSAWSMGNLCSLRTTWTPELGRAEKRT